jgi:hypothetical protein
MATSSLAGIERVRATSDSDVAILAALMVLTLVNCFVSMHWGLPDGATAESTAPWAVDTIAPIGPLNEAFHRFNREGIDNVVYPLFHYVVLAAAYAPYVAIAFLTGELQDPSASFPYGATDPAGFFTTLTVIAGAVSALMAAGIVLFSYLLTRELFGRPAARWAALFAALVPPLAYYGMTSNLDVPYLFWMMLAFWQLARAANHQRLSAYILCGVSAGFAVATKDQAAGFFLAFPLAIPWLVARSLRAPDGRPRSQRAEGQPPGLLRVLLDARVWCAGLAALLAFALANNLLFGGWDGFVRHLQFADTFYERNVATDTASLVARQPAVAAQAVVLAVQMIGPVAIALAVAGLWIAIRERHSLAWVLPLAAITYYLFIIVPTMVLSRYLLGMVLLALPFAGLAVARGLRSSRLAWKRGAIALAVIALAWQSVLLVHLHQSLWRDSRFAMEDWVRENVPPGATIESYTQARYLPRLADRYRYSIVANSFDAQAYELQTAALSTQALADRSPDYVLVLRDSWLSGDPGRIDAAQSTSARQARRYFDDLLAGRAGYRVVAKFETPTWLPYRQVTSGTQPTSILLARAAHP